jgi:hypothetical protein
MGGVMKASILATIITMLGLASLYETIHGSGNVVQVIRDVSGDVSGFNSVTIVAVDMAAIGTLNIQQIVPLPGDDLSKKERLLITAEDNLIPYFVTEVVGEELVIRILNNVHLQPTKPVIFDLWVRDLMHLREVELSGSGDIHAPNLSAEQLSLVLSGSGTVETPNLQPTVKALTVSLSGSGNMFCSGDTATRVDTVSLSGSGNVFCSGEVDRQVIIISGSGNYEAADLASRKTEIVISGSGKAEIHVVDELDAQITGSGTIRYDGNPRLVRKSVTGSGTIRPVT